MLDEGAFISGFWPKAMIYRSDLEFSFEFRYQSQQCHRIRTARYSKAKWVKGPEALKLFVEAPD